MTLIDTMHVGSAVLFESKMSNGSLLSLARTRFLVYIFVSDDGFMGGVLDSCRFRYQDTNGKSLHRYVG